MIHKCNIHRQRRVWKSLAHFMWNPFLCCHHANLSRNFTERESSLTNNYLIIWSRNERWMKIDKLMNSCVHKTRRIPQYSLYSLYYIDYNYYSIIVRYLNRVKINRVCLLIYHMFTSYWAYMCFTCTYSWLSFNGTRRQASPPHAVACFRSCLNFVESTCNVITQHCALADNMCLW